MEKCFTTVLTCLCVLAYTIAASAAFPTDCDDSWMGDWEGVSCGSFCSDTSGQIVCDFNDSLTDPATTVYAYSDGGDFVIFGDHDGTLFCCDDNDVTMARVSIATDNSDDVVCLRKYNLDTNECAPDDAGLNEITCDFDGDSDWDYPSLVRTRGGTDHVSGSDYNTNCGHDAGSGIWCDDIELGAGASGAGNGDKANGGDGSDSIAATGAYGATLEGEGGDDKLQGTAGGDTIYGDGEDDVIHGLGGADFLYSGTGDNWVNGQGGEDYIDGNSGNDTLCGAWLTDSETDEVHAYSGTDVCTHTLEDDLYDCEDEEPEDRVCPDPPF